MLMLPWIIGTVALLAGIVLAAMQRPRPAGSEWFLALGTVFYAAPLAAFGTEHYVLPQTISALIPAWIPGHTVITYFVGTSLIAASISFIVRRYLRLSAALTALMFALFVVLMHIPAALHHSGNRLFWLIVFRDSTFSVGAFALFLNVSDIGENSRKVLARVVGTWSGVVVLVFAAQHFVHPECLPGVPNARMTPAWVPAPHLLTYAIGVLLAAFGLLLLLGLRARLGAAGVAGIMIALTFGLFLPDALVNRTTTAIIGANYVFDTMLFGGALLLVARVVPEAKAIERNSPEAVVASSQGHSR